MNRLAWIAIWLVGCSQLLLAQLSVELTLPQDKFLPAEEFMAAVKVVNRSGQPLQLGTDPDWIQFVIEQPGGGTLPVREKPPVQKSFTLESSQQGTVKVDLAPCFDLRAPGKYWIHAIVKIKDWGTSMTTKSVPFEVIEGTKIWEQAVGVPGPDKSAPPEMRIYTLQQANYLKELRLYLRVSAPDGTVIKLVNVGPMLSIGRPDPQLDRRNRLHLLQQVGARRSLYLIFNTDGALEGRHTYEYAGTRPRLQWNDNGEIEVKGGTRRLSPDDLPPELEPKNDAETNKLN